MPFIDTFPDAFAAPSTTSRTNITLDILPAGYAIDFDIWQPRLRVDGNEILVTSASVDESEQAAGKTLQVELADLADKSAFTPTASIDFGIGKKIGGVWDESTYQTLLTGAKVQSVSHNVTGQPQNATDRVSVTISSESNEKLNRTSAKGTIIYDPNRVTISDSDFKTLYDKDNQAYSPEVVAVPNLNLAYLLDYVFVTKCGFAGYEADGLPINDYPIERYDVPFGGRYYDALKPFVGMFYPSLQVEDDIVSIHDTTLAKPDGLPAPRAITVGDVTGLNASSERQKLDALLMQFVGLENNYDFTAPRFEYPTETSGNTRIEYERIFIEFRKITSPTTSVVIHDPLNIENKKTYINGVLVEEASDVYEFDATGEYAHRLKTVKSLLPGLPSGTSAFVQNSQIERESFVYQAHPFKPRSRYLSRRTLIREGLVTNDPDNPNVFGNPAKQAWDVALRSNNIASGQTFTFETLGSRMENSVPQRDGTVITRVTVTDEVNPSQPLDYIEKRPGDIGVSSFATTAQQMPVFAVDNATRSLMRVDSFNVGPLPLKYALPLTERVLVNRQTASGTVTMPFIGYDETLVKGVTVSATGRAGQSFGNFVITGVNVVINSGGLVMNLTCRQIASTANPLQKIATYNHAIASGTQEIWTLPVGCSDGFVLTTDPHSVSNVGIEARHVGDIAWVDLETTEVDLSPWDGTTQDFEFRITAGTVTVPTRVSFYIVITE